MHAPLTDEASMRAWVEAALRTRDAGAEVPFATVDAATGRVLGSTRFMSIAPAHRRLEIGWTWLDPTARGSGANSEAKLLMLEHAFERLGAMRVEFKTDALNARSRAALAGIGATFEGIFRRHLLMAERAGARLRLVRDHRRGLAGCPRAPPGAPCRAGRPRSDEERAR